MFRQNPGLAIAISLCLFSLAGCPPLTGFYTKLQVLKNVMELGNYSLAIIVIISSVISTCNYLALTRVINQDPAYSVTNKEIHVITFSPAQQIAYLVGMVLIMLMFISSGPGSPIFTNRVSSKAGLTEGICNLVISELVI